VAEVDPSPARNEKVRAIATAALKKWTCQYDPSSLKY
jgi:hypothetical protein